MLFDTTFWKKILVNVFLLFGNEHELKLMNGLEGYFLLLVHVN